MLMVNVWNIKGMWKRMGYIVRLAKQHWVKHHKYINFGHYSKISELAGKNNLLSYTVMLFKTLIPNVYYTLDSFCHLK